MVADMRTSLRSSLCSIMHRRTPRRKSPWRWRSWTSSKMSTLYCESTGSNWSWRRRSPGVDVQKRKVEKLNCLFAAKCNPRQPCNLQKIPQKLPLSPVIYVIYFLWDIFCPLFVLVSAMVLIIFSAPKYLMLLAMFEFISSVQVVLETKVNHGNPLFGELGWLKQTKS